MPFDVCPEAILAASGRLAGAYPGLEVHGVAGDFGRHLSCVPEKRSAPRLVAFLGGTIGNFEPGSRAPFLRSVAELMDGDDVFLMGTDLAGDASRIQPAYDDSAGVTADFNLNLLRVLNRELDADFDLGAFAHVAIYDPEPPWIEMRLRSLADQVVTVRELGLEVRFAEGEEMRTEISCKFTRPAVAGMYADAGLELVEWHEDPRGWFAVSTARRVAPEPQRRRPAPAGRGRRRAPGDGIRAQCRLARPAHAPTGGGRPAVCAPRAPGATAPRPGWARGPQAASSATRAEGRGRGIAPGWAAGEGRAQAGSAGAPGKPRWRLESTRRRSRG